MKIETFNSKNYRVVESQGLFYVQLQVKTKLTTGFLFWKKTIEESEWVRCSESGRELFSSRYFRHYSSQPLSAFTSLEEAMNKIKIFLTPDKIYEYSLNYEGFEKPLINSGL